MNFSTRDLVACQQPMSPLRRILGLPLFHKPSKPSSLAPTWALVFEPAKSTRHSNKPLVLLRVSLAIDARLSTEPLTINYWRPHIITKRCSTIPTSSKSSRCCQLPRVTRKTQPPRFSSATKDANQLRNAPDHFSISLQCNLKQV